MDTPISAQLVVLMLTLRIRVNRALQETLDETFEKRSNLYTPCIHVLLAYTGEMFYAKPETNDIG